MDTAWMYLGAVAAGLGLALWVAWGTPPEDWPDLTTDGDMEKGPGTRGMTWSATSPAWHPAALEAMCRDALREAQDEAKDGAQEWPERDARWMPLLDTESPSSDAASPRPSTSAPTRPTQTDWSERTGREFW